MPSITQSIVGSTGLSEEFSFREREDSISWSRLIEVKKGKMKK